MRHDRHIKTSATVRRLGHATAVLASLLMMPEITIAQCAGGMGGGGAATGGLGATMGRSFGGRTFGGGTTAGNVNGGMRSLNMLATVQSLQSMQANQTQQRSRQRAQAQQRRQMENALQTLRSGSDGPSGGSAATSRGGDTTNFASASRSAPLTREEKRFAILRARAAQRRLELLERAGRR